MPNRSRWSVRAGLLILGIAMLSLAFAPLGQFYLAWLGLAPVMLAVAPARSGWRAFAWGMLAGWLFFLINMSWLWLVTGPGLFALTLYLSIFWGFSAVFIRSLLAPNALILHPQSSILRLVLLALTWTGFEWLRGNVSFLGREGLPWLYLGQSQSPLLVMCQIADVTGVLGITFWLAVLNATVARAVLYGRFFLRDAAFTATVLAGILGYGIFRLSQDTTSPGPTVLVVQSNYPQSNTGEKGAPLEEIAGFHLTTTRDALEDARRRNQRIDLVVWSETMMPPINLESRRATMGTDAGQFWDEVAYQIGSLAKAYDVSILTGGAYYGDWHAEGDRLVARDRRNTAYFFSRDGVLSTRRYDKIHLVPFGEYIPFQHSIPLLYRLFVKLGPNYYEEYVLQRGGELTVFELSQEMRFVVPICFEDVVPQLVASMLRGQGGTRRADFIVNITNDGWFAGGQMAQHLQAAIFRSIENRVPTARSVNTGISAFIDSYGRVSATIPAGTEGARAETLLLDRRVSIFTRVGDVFGLACAGGTIGAVLWMILAGLRYKRRFVQSGGKDSQ